MFLFNEVYPVQSEAGIFSPARWLLPASVRFYIRDTRQWYHWRRRSLVYAHIILMCGVW